MKNWPIKITLFINYFVFAILLNSVGTVILQVQNSYAVSETAAAVLEAFKDLPIAITSLLVASQVARIGYRKSMLVSLALVGAACLAMPLLPTFWMTKLLFAVTGVGFSLTKVSAFATLGLLTNDRKEHVSLMNFLESFFMVGVLSGYFVFSAFVDDSDPGSMGWLDVYYVLSAMSFFAFALLCVAKLDESSIKSGEAKPLTRDFLDMLSLCAKPLILIFVVSAFLYVLIEQSIMTWLPTLNSRVLNLSTSLSIQMASILAASTAMGRFAAGFAFKKLDWFKVLTVGLLLAGALVLVALPMARAAAAETITSWRNAPLAAFLLPMIGFCIAPVYPAINSIILSALPLRQHAPMAGLIVVFSALGGTSGSLITGALFERWGGGLAFYFSLLPIALILVSLYFLKRQTDVSIARNDP